MIVAAFFRFYLSHLLLLNETKSAFLFLFMIFGSPAALTQHVSFVIFLGSKDFSCHYL
jgi:hypothetical protein